MPGVQKPHCSACALSERGLQRIQLAVGRGQALDGLDVVAVGLHREHDARPRRLAVEEDRARAADAVLAPDVRAGQAEILAEEIAEQQARLDLAAVPRAVHGDVDGDVRAHEARSVTANRGRPDGYARPCDGLQLPLRWTSGRSCSASAPCRVRPFTVSGRFASHGFELLTSPSAED